ncbi:hypothetical protein [Streptomyces sp. CAI-155]|uniref:hypothetical protein n=1 Tax=Streptomyces sp. CAI-155 TaxID=1472660 RepID=UPI001587B85B|nr:hypothetical protein [Streptomyces sp. CAI-155]NUV82382.1 hypothetical protein [Streptomyces sp. CAI-155]
MQRTRFTTSLLVGVAVAAVSGCVSVDPQTGPSRPPRAESGGPAQDVIPQIVQPPGREALETIVEPSPSPGRPAPPAPSAAAASEARRAGPPSAPRPPERAAPPPRRTPSHRVPGLTPPLLAPSGVLPALPRARGGPHDVCALGRGYGSWPAGSQENRICEKAYGR